ncbi:MAG: thioredoxin family protein [Candidatus Sumerlaeaceae bacterium]
MIHHRRTLLVATGMLFGLAVPGISLAQPQPAVEQVFQLPLCGTMPVPTQMHGSAVLGDRFYIFGGDTPQGWTNEVYSARYSPEKAQLTGWRREKELPERRAYLVNSVETVNDRIYILGGAVAETSATEEGKITRAQDVLWTSVKPDGVIAEWKRSEKFPGQALSLLASCSDDKHIYVTGGSSGSTMSNAVHVADLAADGAPANWRSAGILPKAMRFHGAAIQNARLYTWGGQATRAAGDAMKDVYSAPMQNGLVGQWRNEPEMPAAVYSSSSCGFNDYLISVGGRYVNGHPTNSLWFSRLNPDGTVMPWIALKTNLDARVYHSLGLDKTRGIVFISGGKNKITPEPGSGTIQDKVAIFRLTQSARPDVQPQNVATQAGTHTDLDTAIAAARQNTKPVLAFLYAPDVPDCRRAMDNVISSPQFQALQQNYTIARVDVSASNGAEASRKLSVFRVPALVLLDAAGAVKKKITGVQKWSDVQEMLSSR